MPVSSHLQISQILDQILKRQPGSILDVGCGLGIYGALARIYLEGDNLYDRSSLSWNKKENWTVKIDAVEGFDKYITPFQIAVYNEIFVKNVLTGMRHFGDKVYDLVLAIDILEHLDKQNGTLFIRELQRIGKSVILATPAEFISQVVPENPLEDHLSLWTRDELNALEFTVTDDAHSLIGLYTTCTEQQDRSSTAGSSAVVSRLYRPGDEDGIMRLFREVFGRDMTAVEWHWKYRGGASEKVYSSIAVMDNGEVVAHYGGVPHRMIHQGKEMFGLAIGDVMVHPKLRGLKLFKKTAELVPEEAVRNNIFLGYGFPNERALRLPEKLGLYEKIEDVYEAIKEVRFRKTAGRYFFRFSPLSFDDSRIDSLWNEVKASLRLAVVRDREYLTWRYQKHPIYSYELWGLQKRWGGRLLGLAVMRRDGDRMLLVDFVGPFEMLKNLLMKVENYTWTAGSKLLVLWHPEFLNSRLSALGFTIAPSVTCIPRTTHELTMKKEEIKGNFFYTMGDTDFL